VDFAFDRAAFYFKALPLAVPYPVPFALLGDEAKGWIDTTYLSRDGTFRLTRGNKGTLFVLVRDDPPRRALAAAAAGNAAAEEVEALAVRAAREGGERAPARSARAAGTWRLVYSRQGAGANPFQRLLAGQVANFQIISEDGSALENRVELAPGVRVRALAAAEADSASRTGVDIEQVVLEAGPLR
jgi:hypothetical protein